MTSKTTARYEIVTGTRGTPGEVLRTFPTNRAYRCGGAATACLRAFCAIERTSAGPIFFRKVA